MNDAEVNKIIAILNAHAPHHQVTDETYIVWAWALEDIPFDAATFAVRDWIKYHKHFPYPVELREAIIGALMNLPDADAAWSMVQERIRSTYPGFPAPSWDAPTAIIDAVKEIGGIYTLRQSERPDQDRQRFRAVYGEARAEAIKRANVADLWERHLTALPAGVHALTGRQGVA